MVLARTSILEKNLLALHTFEQSLAKNGKKRVSLSSKFVTCGSTNVLHQKCQNALKVFLKRFALFESTIQATKIGVSGLKNYHFWPL